MLIQRQRDAGVPLGEVVRGVEARQVRKWVVVAEPVNLHPRTGPVGTAIHFTQRHVKRSPERRNLPSLGMRRVGRVTDVFQVGAE